MTRENKTIYLLNIDRYAPAITALTYPLIYFYADRIGAEVCVISKREYHEWPVVYEKLQIYGLAQARKDDWAIYIDSDALIHPECVDFTEHLPRDTVAHHGADMAGVRWKYDHYFRRDGRNIGSCNWFTIASSWCLDLWRPLEELTFEEAVRNIRPTMNEENTVITADHLIDDYVLSRNIARFGLKFTTIIDLMPRIGLPEANFFWHQYTVSVAQKVEEMKKVLEAWKLPTRILSAYGQ